PYAQQRPHPRSRARYRGFEVRCRRRPNRTPQQRRQRRPRSHRRPQKPRALVRNRNRGRMIFTARQLEELHKTNGHIVLPYRARLSPMAQDWVRAKKIQLGYSDNASPLAASQTNNAAPPVLNSNFLYWCDG